MNDQVKDRMKYLIDTLNQASKAYYQKDKELMSNKEYDELYDELENLELQSNLILSNSPTQRVGDEMLDFLPKETHHEPMLSLSKTKEITILEEFLGDEEGILSWKLDGLTIVLTYENGMLQKGVTRGNGQQGEVITTNVTQFQNVPLKIPYKDHLVIRGEAIIHYSDFKKINEEIEDVDSKYKNPRNLCSGSVRQLNSKITKQRQVYFYAFTVVNDLELNISDSFEDNLIWLAKQGFSVVEFVKVDRSNLKDEVNHFKSNISKVDTPSDGLVLVYDSISYGKSLGTTAKAPKNALAFKWEDEEVISTLVDVYWSPSRTGLINPVAVFEPVEIEGTQVQRASLHNVSVFESFQLGIGDQIKVYKANMIIPQISENLTSSSTLLPPKHCPICNSETMIKEDLGVKTLHCLNPDCQIKKLKGFELFVSRDGMNIEGLSLETLEKFIREGLIKEFVDLYCLEKYEDRISSMKGFGLKSYSNIIESIQKSKDVKASAFLYSLGIEYIGVANAKILANAVEGNLFQFFTWTPNDFLQIEGIGEKIADSLFLYFQNPQNQKKITELLNYINILPEERTKDLLKDIHFCITGDVFIFENRKALKEYIETLGGKVTGSVSKKTHFLINNDRQSMSSKNKKANELGVPIISEDEFIEKYGKLTL